MEEQLALNQLDAVAASAQNGAPQQVSVHG
jgi:hypothetical protein